MRTVGIDIAGEDSPTGVCVIEWTSCGAIVADVTVAKMPLLGIVAAVDAAGGQGRVPVGIDAPFGFPLAFAQAVVAMRNGAEPPRGNPRWRITENHIKTTKNALSSVTSLITNTVSGRCFPLRYALAGPDSKDLVGYSTYLFEVYPAAALVSWGVSIARTNDEMSYKTKGQTGEVARRRVLADLLALATCDGAPWLHIPHQTHRQLLADKDDAIDALVSALVARVVISATRPTDPATAGLSPAEYDAVLHEGWIHLPPSGSLSCLPGNAATWFPVASTAESSPVVAPTTYEVGRCSTS